MSGTATHLVPVVLKFAILFRNVKADFYLIHAHRSELFVYSNIMEESNRHSFFD
jgi:hypothetical protein